MRRVGKFAVVAAGLAIVVALGLHPGAKATETRGKGFTERQRSYWAFQPVARPEVPQVSAKDWVRNPIDAFVLAKLEEKGIRPNAVADKVTLLRRASLVMTGLPPTPEQVQEFLSDNSANAWERVVDRLLESPDYGERWARHWLDVARYADSEGFKSDETRPNIWRYRDYVIKSLNDDKPYDRFILEQIAGDELFPGSPDALIATGFNRHFPDESNAANIMQRRQELLNDVTDAVGSAFLAMTVGCAKCHDHKFDPILQKDYYRLQSFFSNTRIEDEAPLISAERRAQWEARNRAYEAKTASIRARMDQLIGPKREARYAERLSRFPEEIQAVITMSPEKRNAYQWQMYHKAKAQVTFSEEEIASLMKGADKEAYLALKQELAAFDDIKPAPLPVAQTMIDDSSHAPKTFVLSQANYEKPLEEVQPGFLSILDPADAKIEPSSTGSSGRRSVLAKWLADPANPLTARVMVNRVWHYHFGRGIVGSPNDFGLMGERPANRDLLDWLASEFVKEGWSIKKLQKKILMSRTWQLSSEHQEAAAEADPDNKYLWRFSRRRLEGEAIRDSMLQVAGVLNPKMGGPGVFPPMPAGVMTRGGWHTEKKLSETRRRSVYTFVRRNTRYPMFEAFDMPDTHESCARRNNTTSPGQALELMNNELVLDWARGLAERVGNDPAGMSPASQIERAYRLVYSRAPKAEELKAAQAFLERHDRITGDRKATMVDFCHMLLNSNEFLFLN